VDRRRLMLASLGVAATLLLVACGEDAEEDSPPSSEAAAEAEAEEATDGSTTSSSAAAETFDSLGTQMAAIDTVLVYCIPGLPGSPREGCDLGRISDGIDELTTSARAEIEAGENRDDFADVSAAIEEMDGAVSDLAGCESWFASGGSGPDAATSAACAQSWDGLTASWEALTAAIDWP
jgi:hypothetical protein